MAPPAEVGIDREVELARDDPARESARVLGHDGGLRGDGDPRQRSLEHVVGHAGELAEGEAPTGDRQHHVGIGWTRLADARMGLGGGLVHRSMLPAGPRREEGPSADPTRPSGMTTAGRSRSRRRAPARTPTVAATPPRPPITHPEAPHGRGPAVPPRAGADPGRRRWSRTSVRRTGPACGRCVRRPAGRSANATTPGVSPWAWWNSRTSAMGASGWVKVDCACWSL